MQDYFKKRIPENLSSYEENYWHIITDPDGKIRNRLEERDIYLDDIKEELNFLNGLSPGKILDFGCGPGFLLSALSTDWEKHGVEISKFAAEHAKQWANIFVGNIFEAKYKDKYFDVVVMYHVIEHLEDPVSVIKEVYRILNHNGILLLATPDFDSACARRFGQNYRLLQDKTHISLFSNDSMHRFLRDHGFIIDKVSYPFFETRHFTPENLLRLFDTTQISPPFYGNFMTFYCHKP